MPDVAIKKIVVFDQFRSIQGHLSDCRKALAEGRLIDGYAAAERAQMAAFDLKSSLGNQIEKLKSGSI